MAKVTLTDEAVEDFKEVKAQSLKNFPATTTVYLHGMKMAIKVVANNDIGSDESADTWPGVQSWPYQSHDIYFLRHSAGITVIGIIHQARNPKLLRNRKP